MNYNVIYYEKFGKAKAHMVSNICFSGIYRGNHPDSINYHAKVRFGMTREEINKYIAFLKEILVPNSFRVRVSDKGDRIWFLLNTKKMQRACALLHLTAFRYVDEFEPVMKPWLAKKYNSVEEAFDEFMILNRCLANACYNMSGHGLVYEAYGALGGNDDKSRAIASTRCVRLKTFKTRLIKNSCDTVQAYTTKPKKVGAKAQDIDDPW